MSNRNGLDGRHRDENGEIRQKNGNTLIGTLRKMRKRLEDGSIFEEIREQLKTKLAGKGPEEHAAAAEFVDLLRSKLHIPLPNDLVAFADKHRRPAT